MVTISGVQSAANKNEAGKAAVGEVLVPLFLIMYFENVVFESYKTRAVTYLYFIGFYEVITVWLLNLCTTKCRLHEMKDYINEILLRTGVI